MRINKLSVSRLLLMVICIITYVNVSAQERINGFFLNPKLGIYNWNENDAGGLLSVEAGIINDKKIFMTSYSRGEQVLGPQIMNSIDLSYGMFSGEKLFRFQYQAGLSLLWGDSRFEYNQDKSNFVTVGIPLKLGFKIIPIKYVSIGIDLQVNINLENTMYMPMISLEFGKLR